MSGPLFRCGLAVNLGRRERLSFDAALRHATRPIAVLCDGANGTPNGGGLARDATKMVLEHLAEGRTLSGQSLEEMGAALETKHPESGCTLLALKASCDGVDLFGVGDSFAEVYELVGSQWRRIHALERHLDEFGHPTQLIGARVAISPATFSWSRAAKGSALAAFLMSDGAGAYLTGEDLRDVLAPVGDQLPSDDDLTFCAETLAARALHRGSDDDISVVLAWIGCMA